MNISYHSFPLFPIPKLHFFQLLYLKAMDTSAKIGCMKILLIFIIIIVLLFLLTLWLIAPSRPNKDFRASFQGLKFAHRGLHTKDRSVPENSLAAFQRAAEAGYGIELDVRFTKDLQIVVFHDNTLLRVCGIDRTVDSYTYEELRTFHLFESEEHIPLFFDVLSLVDGRVPLLVELKTGSKNQLLCERTLQLLRNYHGQFCIESFHPMIVRWFRLNAPDILRGQLSAAPEELSSELSPFCAFLLGNVLTNFLARPHFLSYHKVMTSISAQFYRTLGGMQAVWTLRDSDPDTKEIIMHNDMIIFEFFRP